MVSRIISFMRTDIWRMRLKDFPRSKSFLIKQLRILLLAVRGFDEDKCALRASALTFFSLLSIVPVLAMAFGIAKGFGFQRVLESQLLSYSQGYEELMAKVIGFAKALLENTQGGVVAGAGVALLFWSVTKVLGNIEDSLNTIWGIKKPRALGRKFSDYLSAILICPILFIVSSSTTVFITTQITFITERVSLLGPAGPIIFSVLELTPYGIIWVLFTFLYIFMPNTKVKLTSALVGGIIAGTIYQVVQWTFITFQIGVAKYNAIYGGFAVVPLFLTWLQASWFIVLFGAEISFAHQNVDMYEFEPDCLRVSPSFKKLLSLHVARLLTKTFAGGGAPHTAASIARTLEMPIRLVREILYELVESAVASEVSTKEYREPAYQPARALDTLTIHAVIDALEERGTRNIPLPDTETLKTLSESLQTFRNAIATSPANRLLKDI
jgi:membrane protein